MSIFVPEGPRPPGRPRQPGRWLFVLAGNLVMIGLLAAAVSPMPALPRGLVWASLSLWLVDVLLGLVWDDEAGAHTWVRVGVLSLAAVGGALSLAPSLMVGLPCVVAAVVRAMRLPARPEWRWGHPGVPVVTGVTVLAMIIGAVAWQEVTTLGWGVFAVLLVLLVGFARQASRRAAEQERRLLRQELATEREHAQNAALVERARLAGELHDVLAHSLGALTAQLNAAEALADAGRWEEVRQKVVGSRRLAADGLLEARRAVAALRSPGSFADTLDELVSVHRESGALVELEVTGEPTQLDESTALTARRVVQELLTNARKHAPATPVDLEVSWTTDRLTISAVNPLPDPPRPYPGGLGSGLSGLADRCRQLGGELHSSLTGDNEFMVICTLPLGAGEVPR